MRLWWLSLLPLAAAAIAWLSSGHSRLLLMVALAANVACAGLAIAAPLGHGAPFVGQPWVLDAAGRTLLIFMHLASGLLMGIAYLNGEARSYCAPLLAGISILSAVVLLPSPQVSMLLLPIGLTVLVITTSPRVASAPRGAAAFLSWVTLPVPLLLAIFPLLDRLTLYPDEPTLASWAGWLVVPAALVWWTLFPLDGTTRLWSRDGLSLTPVFLWSVKDWVVLYLLFSLWKRDPVLPATAAASVLGLAGLATSVWSGVVAATQSTPSAVLACAAMAALGGALQGITAGNAGALLSGLYLLLCRSAAVMLAASCLAAPCRSPTPESQPNSRLGPWPGRVLVFSFGAAIAALAGAPPWSGFWGRRLVLGYLPVAQPYLVPALALSSLGIAIGLLRAGYLLWQTKVRASQQVGTPQLLLTVLLLALCLWLGMNHQGAVAWLATSFQLWLSPLTF